MPVTKEATWASGQRQVLIGYLPVTDHAPLQSSRERAPRK
jgi:hypothetical protein